MYLKEALRLWVMFWVVGFPILACISFFPKFIYAVLLSLALGVVVALEKFQKWAWSGGYLRLTYGALVPNFLYTIYYYKSDGPERLELIAVFCSILCIFCYPIFFIKNIESKKSL